MCDLIRGQDQETHTLEQLFHIAPLYNPGEAMPFEAGELSVSASAILTQDPGQGNLAILPVDADKLAVRAQKGETNPAVGWYGVLGEFPAWDVTLAYKTVCPARLDAVFYPMPPGSAAYPHVQRLVADERVTSFRIVGEGLDDTFVLCEEGCGAVEIGDLVFEGRALLLRRQPELQALAVDPVTVLLDGQTVPV
jgi:hypothetical protein